MKRVLFAGYDGTDIGQLLPVFAELKNRDIESIVINNCQLPPAPGSVKDALVLDPPLPGSAEPTGLPDVLSSFLSGAEIERLIGRECFDAYVNRRFHAATALRCHQSYLDFVSQSLERYKPSAAVICVGELESIMAEQSCAEFGIDCCSFVPQFFEYNMLEWFEVRSELQAYLVAGAHGKLRLIEKGASPDRVIVTGNPMFDRYAQRRKKSAWYSGWIGRPKEQRKVILYTMQGVRQNWCLLDLLKAYLTKRPECALLVRPHPASPLPPNFAMGGYFADRTSVDTGSIEDALETATVLVTLSSMTVLDALIFTVPAITFKSDFMPHTLPFAGNGDSIGVGDQQQLESALDSLLFDQKFRKRWLDQHQKSGSRYVSTIDGKAAERIAAFLALFPDQRATGSNDRRASTAACDG